MYTEHKNNYYTATEPVPLSNIEVSVVRMADLLTKTQPIVVPICFYIKSFGRLKKSSESKKYFSKCSLGRYMAILRFIITVVVPVARTSCGHKISAHSGDRNMKPFANIFRATGTITVIIKRKMSWVLVLISANEND